MSPDNPFLQALLAQPDDDTLRLAMADWFDENDDSTRAEFVRVQVELARGVDDPVRRRELELRQRDLLVAHDAEWVRPLADVLECRPGEWGGWVFRRGFVEYFRLPVERLITHGAALARMTPFRELTIEGAITAAAAESLVACPYLSRVWLYEADTRGLTPAQRRRFSKRFANLGRRP